MADAFPPVAVGFALGVAASAGGYLLFVRGPLSAMARACGLIRSGDLSRTVPELGPKDLRSIARSINDMAADFQEVLLLFAHMAREARKGGPSAEVDEMSALIRDFRYFRVAIENGTIRDTGVPAPADRDRFPAPAEALPTRVVSTPSEA